MCKYRQRKSRLKLEVPRSIEKYKGTKNIDYVECKICKKRSKRIDIRHLKNRHNLTKEEYQKLFPDALLYCEKYKKIQARPNNKSNIGKKFSKEHRKKISLARTNGIPWDERSLNDYKEYKAKIRYLSEKSFKRYYYKINPENLRRGNDYHLDHIYPIIEGFRNNISTKEISHFSNLRIISAIDNLKKGDKIERK